MSSRKIIKIIILFLLFFGIGSSYGYASQLGLIVKYADSGGGAGDLNQIGDNVNGRNICPSLNTNTNNVPGCDMSKNVGYNNNNTLNNASDDFYNGDLIVRTNDIFSFNAGRNWIKAGDGVDSVTITCNLPAAQSAIRPGYKRAFLPGSCGAGSSVSTDGKTITCVRIGFDPNEIGAYSEDLPFGVSVLGGNENGYQPGDINCTASSINATTISDNTDNTSLTITASPRWNIQEQIYTYTPGQVFNGQTGWLVYYKQYIEVDEVNGSLDSIGGFLGNESLGNDATITYTNDLSQISPNAQLYDCDPDIGWINGGDPLNYYNGTHPERSIATPEGVQSMNCVSSGTGGTISVTVEHLDATLNHYPTYDRRGNALPVNRKIAAINLIRVFIPLDDVKNGEDGLPNTIDDGELTTKMTVSNFDPNGISSLSNFGSSTENTLDNSQDFTLYYAQGYRDKYYRGIYNTDGTRYPRTYPYDIMDYRSGRGNVTPGAIFYTEQNYSNLGGSNITGVKLCDVFDANTYDTFADRSTNLNDGGVWSSLPGTPMHLYNSLGVSSTPFHYEYATTYKSSTRPLDPYSTHGQAVADECSDIGTTWYTDYYIALSNGPITKARLVMDGPVLPGATILRRIGHKARSTNLNGVLLTGGTLLPNYASFSDSLNDRYGTFWKYNDYRPNNYAVAHNGRAGDRLTLQRAKARITKSATPLNNGGTPTGSPASSPGLQIKYTLTGSFTTDGALGETANIKIKDLLPLGIKYVAGSTEGSIGEPTISNDCNLVQDLVSQGYTCTSESEILIRDLGNRNSNTTIPSIVFRALVSINVAEGSAANYATIESPVDSSLPVQRTANANIIISIPRSLIIVKNIEQGRNQFNTDGLSDWVKFNINMRNGTPLELTNVDMIDVFPFVGDNSLGVKFTVGSSTITSKRNPATSYTGLFEFVNTSIENINNCNTGGLARYYTNKDPSQINLSPTDDSNQLGGSTNRCIGTENGPNISCGFTRQQTTAVRAVGPNLGSQGVCKINIKFATDKNQGGNIYSNNAGAYAQGVSLPVLSNTVSAFVYDYKIGDTVWFDNNQNGIYDLGEPATSGAIISLYDGIGNLIRTTITSSTGYYIFTGLKADTYRVTLSPISGSLFGYDQDSTNKLSDGTTLLTVTGSNITNRFDIDFGLYRLSTIGGNIYLDNDISRNMNVGDLGLSGMIVTLSGYDLLGSGIYMTGIVSSTGAYIFTGLNGGLYTVSYVNNTLYIPEIANIGTVSGVSIGNINNTNTISNISVNYGGDSINNNFGLAVPAAINGNVWYDMDANMMTGGSEIYTSGAKISVTYTNSVEGTVTKTLYTDTNGNWSLTGLQTGSIYTVSVDMSYGPANGYRITTNNVTYSGTVGYAESKFVGSQGLYLTNVRISKTVDVTDATIGDVINYTISYSNNSSGTAYNVSVYDLFPFDFLAINSSSPGFGSPASTAGIFTPTTLTYFIGTLAPGQAGTITISATVITGTDAQIINNLGAIDTTGTGFVTGSTITVNTGSIMTNTTGSIETSTGDNTSTALVTIYRIDLNIVKDADRNAVGPNDIFEYTLHIGNNTGTVNKVVVIDTLDPNLVYVAMSTGTLNGTPLVNGQVLTWTGITLAPNSTNTIKILVKPKQYLPAGTILNNDVIIGRINNIGAVVPLYETNSSNNASSAQVILSGTNYTTIAGSIYFDQNTDKSINGSDIYISGVVVNLISGNTIIASATTDSVGGYIFTGLIAGSYDLAYIYPSGYIPFTSKGGIGASTNGLGSINSGSISITGVISNILADGNNSINNNFGLVKVSSIAGIIYQDLAANLNKDPIDILLANQTVMLAGTDVFGNIVSLTMNTNSSGAYLFDNLLPGTYTVSYTNGVSNLNPLASFTGSVGAISSTSQTINNIRLNADIIAINYDFSLSGIPSSIAGQIYLDSNLNKINNSSEMGLAGFTVNLSGINILGDMVNLTTNVDNNGKYIFSGLADGVYAVSYTNNSVYISEVANTGTVSSAKVGNVISTTGINNIRIFYGQDSINNDFGLVQTSSIAGIIYQDLDKSKNINSEPGLVGQIVYLNGIDILGNNISINTTTDSNGGYIFNLLVPGTYSVSYNNTHNNLSPFASNPGSMAGNSNGYQVINNIDLAGNVNAVNYNFGLIETIYKQTIAGNIYIDENSSNDLDNGDLKYMSGGIVILSGTDLSGNMVNLSTVASIDGSYKFTNLAEGIYDVYLDTNSVAGYIHHITNAGNILGSGNGGVNNLKIQSIALGFEQDSISNNFGLTHMDLTTGIACMPKSGKAGDTVSCTITYSNQGITDSNNTVIDLSSTAGLIINSADLTKNIGILAPGQNGSYTITVQIANNPNIILNTLDINSHIYSTSTPELDILTNYAKDSIFVLPEDLFTIAGNVYDDQDASKYKSAIDLVYSSANIYLNGSDRFGRPVSAMISVGTNGKYIFTGLIAGNYNLSLTNLNSNYFGVSSNAGTISGNMIGVGSTENISGSKTLINGIHLLSDGINYNFGLVMVPDPIKPAGTVYTPSPVIEIPVIKEEPKEEIVIKEIIKQAKEIVTEKMHKAAEVNAKNLPEDMIFHSLPNTGVDM